ncbi:MAG TPA: hypothetical protein VGG76_00540 [Gemmatimonadaceae bacterium]
MTYPMATSSGHPVRPGSSDALTARTIDATVHTPLVRAQESAAALVPRMTSAVAPLTSPLVLSGVALVLTFILIARRMRYRPSAILVGALLVMTLSSFHPMEPQLQPIPIARGRTPRTLSRLASIQAGRRVYSTDSYSSPQVIAAAPVPDAADVPDVPEAPESPATPEPVDMDHMRWTPPAIVEQIPDMSREVMRSAERMVHENEQLRAIMEQLRERMREEARRARWRRLAGKRHIRPDDIESFGMVTP